MIIMAMLLFLTSGFGQTNHCERIPLARPEYNCEVEMDESAWERDKNMGWESLSRENVRCSYDQSTGIYTYTYPDIDGGETVSGTWEPSWNVDVTISASIETESSGDAFKYEYVVSSASTSLQNVMGLIIDVREWPNKMGSPSKPWKVWALSESDWERRLVSWTCFEKEDAQGSIKPGKHLAGFVMHSQWLPDILMCWIQGDGSGVILRSNGMPEVILSKMPIGLLEGSVYGYTVAPGWQMEAAQWPRMREFLEESKKQHWITEEAAQRLAVLLDQAEKAEASADQQEYRTTLAGILDAVKELYTQEEVNMTSEAYALFYYHTEARLKALGESATAEKPQAGE